MKTLNESAPDVLGSFFGLAAVITAAALITLLQPNGPIDFIWAAKRTEQAWLISHTALAQTGFFALFAICATTSVGCFLQYRWAWFVAVLMIGTNFVAATLQLFNNPSIGMVAGLVTAATITAWTLMPSVRRKFR